MANEPAYWQQLKFVDTQNEVTIEHGVEDLRKLKKLINQRAAVKLAVLSDEYATGRQIFRELKARIEANCEAHPYTSAKQEATRMAWARGDLANSTDPAHLLSAAFRLHEGEKGYPLVPSVTGIVVKKIVVVRNQALWDAYDLRRQALAANRVQIAAKLERVRDDLATGEYNGVAPVFDGYPFLNDDVAEALLYHGTDATRFIVETNIDPSRGRNKGTVAAPNYGLLGQGAYFSDQIAKSATYTQCRLCRGFKCNCTGKDGVTPVLRVTLLARVCLGRIHNAPTLSVGWDREGLRSQTHNTPILNNSDSILASGSGLKKAAGSNEIAIRNISQIYPEFVVYWHHPVPAHPYAELWDNASRVAMANRQVRRVAKQAQIDLERNQLADQQADLQALADLPFFEG